MTTKMLSSSEPLEAGKSSPIPFATSSLPLSNRLAYFTFVQRYQRTRASTVVSSTSKISMSSWFSINTGVSGSGVASGVTPTPPVPESRPSMDLSGSRLRVDSTRPKGDSFRSRTDSARSRQLSPHPLPQVLEADGTTEEHSDVEKEMDDDGDRPLRGISKHSTVMKDRTTSMDSEASLYTQNGRSSDASHQQLPHAGGCRIEDR